MNKLIRDGRVAVLVSPGFGAGWSTWADNDIREDVLFDPGVVELVEQAKWEELQTYVTLKYPNLYTGGMRDLEIEWLPMATEFIINEHDGSETLEVKDDIVWHKA